MAIERSSNKKKIDSEGGVKIADSSTEVACILRGYRRPRWRGRSCRLAALTLELTGDSELEFPFDLRVIGDPNPSIEVASVLRGYCKPQWWGWGRRLAAPAHEWIENSDSVPPVDSGG
ncbi:hypothetical protein CRG98_035800 [Punica granatum]|uniref:Uncharacterized protein n=1 Tax=Punica granatum TaxID=22663 RepID=A0A2I0IIF4_PUNGR|nr:hypothetical protein CRG98_035800 [Punica granatum]